MKWGVTQAEYGLKDGMGPEPGTVPMPMEDEVDGHYAIKVVDLFGISQPSGLCPMN